jgi:glycolate oxidase FAD binding subunit
LIVRVGVPPKDAADYVSSQAQLLDRGAYVVDVASGLIWGVASPESVGEAKTWLAALRAPALAAGGYAVAVRVPEDWRESIDVWGYSPDALDLMRKLKSRWDPANILGAGEFVA